MRGHEEEERQIVGLEKCTIREGGGEGCPGYAALGCNIIMINCIFGKGEGKTIYPWDRYIETR